MPEDSAVARRKDAHLDLCAVAEVAPRENDTLLSDVQLVHCALPELALAEIDLSTEMFGKRLKYPLLVTGMTGGTPRAGMVNRDLASLAEEHGVAFGVGSQRAMNEDESRAESFRVRDVAPTALLLGNIGVTQAAQLGLDGVRRLIDAISADGIAVHLNVAQELGQAEGDRDFRGGFQVLRALAAGLGDRLLVKETGCGISPSVAQRLVDCGVRAIDVSGLGGTAWTRVEQLRAPSGGVAADPEFSSWGIPTAAALASVRRAIGEGVTLISSGGIRSGLDVAKSLALGANLAGMALPLFRAQQEGGRARARETLQRLLLSLRQAALLTGSRSLGELRHTPTVITGRLKDWLNALA